MISYTGMVLHILGGVVLLAIQHQARNAFVLRLQSDAAQYISSIPLPGDIKERCPQKQHSEHICPQTVTPTMRLPMPTCEDLSALDHRSPSLEIALVAHVLCCLALPSMLDL